MAEAAQDVPGITWKMNPAASPHYGGVWERKVGSLKRILDGIMVTSGRQRFDREEFATLIIEAEAIINTTPLWHVSNDPDDPRPLSPFDLLTTKEPVPEPISLSLIHI